MFTGDRGAAVTAMAEAFARFILTRRDVGGHHLGGRIGRHRAGDAGDARAADRHAQGHGLDRRPAAMCGRYVGPSDICMMYSGHRCAGINRISEQVLSNAAHALAGMIAHQRARRSASRGKPAIGLTMFGVTTPCVQAVTGGARSRL